ncbi:MAG: 2-methylcitrate dehydratase [Blastomonas sp. CACIA14H2]|uniref:MmgE/PrpD family protein n=1 Tax=Blastomonas sp. CACIA14H2 TaxID=1419876 RepID=UPI0003D01203|nr:MAG: 2-methylcitrate dehydratase [Blastomonas sp. CACIA14H2]
MSATDNLLAFVRAEHRLPAEIGAAALHLLGDTLAVGAAGATAPGADGVLAAARGWGTGEDARLIGSDERLPAASAAFVNGFRIHCLEWDAVHEPAVVHAMSVVTAALGASIDRMGGCDPDAALTALAIGVDIAAGLGVAATSPLTFFRPATAGCIGAALAVARIEGVEPLEDVLGLAYSSVAGTMQAHVEGSIALPLQVANAARAAVASVDLVRAGLTGPHDALEGPFGYFRLIDQGDLASYTRDLGRIWRIGEISVKPYPSGRASHAVLGTIADLQLDPGEVEAIEAHVPPLIARLVGRPPVADMTPAYARLCLPVLTALMLTDGRIDPRRFVPETLADPAIRALADRLVITVDGNPDPNALFPQRLVVRLTDGRTIERAIPHTLGSPDAPLSHAGTAAKRALARELAEDGPDARVFDDPLQYFANPHPFVPSEVEERAPRSLDFARDKRG